MSEAFRKSPRVSKSYSEQGEIYFICRNYERQTAKTKEHIDALIRHAGGDYAPALKAYLTTDIGYQETCDKYYISQSTLDRIKRRFYESW